MLLVGTTNGLWEIGAHPTRRWLRQHQHLRRVLANKPIAALTRLPTGGALAATADGMLWQCLPGQRWHHHTLSMAATDKQEYSQTTALAVGDDGRIWRGATPMSVWHTSPTSHASCSWQHCATLSAQPEAWQWWGPCDVATPLVTAITPDPRDAQAVTIAIAVGGVYHTADGGQTWQAQHSGIAPLMRQEAQGYDAHRNVLYLTRHPAFPEVLYATSESAIYRAATTSATWCWEDITPPHAHAVLALPGQVTPDPVERDTALAVLPLLEDETHCTLWQTRDGGATWQECAGAPVLSVPSMTSATSDAAAVAIVICQSTPAHIAVVTPDGDIYIAVASDTPSWQRVATGLGTVTCSGWAEG